MRLSDVLDARLATQRLTSAPLSSAAEVVGLLAGVQCQERDHALFSLGLRLRGETHAALRAALAAGAFVRTHVLCPTWHFVLPEDLRWMLALTSPRVEASLRARHRGLGLDDTRLVGRAFDALADMLAGPRPMTRADIGAELGRRGVAIATGAPVGHLLMLAELRGLICSAPGDHPQHAYALVDEVVPPTPPLPRDEALVRLVHRFFTGHGPASVHDCARWASLTLTDVRAALARIGEGLARVEVDGTPLWFDPAAHPGRRPDAPRTFLLPVYDEVVMSYPRLGFPRAPGHPHPERPDPFWGWIVHDRTNVGLWKRTVSRGTVVVDARVATSLDGDARAGVRAAARRLADFLERDLDYRESAPA